MQAPGFKDATGARGARHSSTAGGQALHGPVAQSLSCAQLVLQAVAPQTNGAHGVVAPCAQLPLPSHEPAAVCCPPVHVAAAQAAPEGTSAHAPAWHNPVEPHTSGFCTVQRLRGSSWLFFAGLHVPLGPVLISALHAWQAVLHAVLQHMPSTQWPVAHCASAVHALPCAISGAQWLFESQ